VVDLTNNNQFWLSAIMNVVVSRYCLEDFENKIADYVDVVSSRLGGEVVRFSDEWFADAVNLIKPTPPIRQAGKFTPKGAWYDGWETRRHNPEPVDWVIFRLGVFKANIVGAEVDTAFFSGNHAPAISVEGVSVGKNDVPGPTADWKEIIPIQECGPSQRHFLLRDKPTEQAFTHIRLRMYPDGGIARFRLYGLPVPEFPDDLSTEIDLAHVSNGGVAVLWSDKHFSSPDNLLISGRGVDMSDGWETARSRTPGHVDWVVVKLGARGRIDRIIVDTAYFLGNYPKAITVEGLNAENVIINGANDSRWEMLVPESQTSPGKEHEYLRLKGLADISSTQVFTHVKLTIIPDGGVKRLRVFGRRVSQ
jgi:allantoicase